MATSDYKPTYEWVVQWMQPQETQTSSKKCYGCHEYFEPTEIHWGYCNHCWAAYRYPPEQTQFGGLGWPIIGGKPQTCDDAMAQAKAETIDEFKKLKEDEVQEAFEKLSPAQQLIMYQLLNARGLRMHTLPYELSKALAKEWNDYKD